MGYRFYFYAVPKKIVEKVRGCRTEKDYVEMCKSNGIKYDVYDNEVPFVPPYNLGEEVYEFGKDIDFYDEIYKDSKSLFSTIELKEKYIDYNPIICDKNSFLLAIKNYHNKIIKYYKGLLSDENEFSWDDSTVQEKQKEHIENQLREWENNFTKPYNLDLQCPTVVTSWLYEYSIFELVRLYKTFDWENDDLIFMGW